MTAHATSVLVTHSGSFHADDVCAAAVLSLIFPVAPIVRTRDDAWIAQAVASQTAIVFDVGHRFNPEARVFDHHMPDAPKRRDGTPFSAFGLIWGTYGRNIVDACGVSPKHAHVVWGLFDTQIVRLVDLIDNGMLSPSDIGQAADVAIGSIVGTFNLPFDAVPQKATEHAQSWMDAIGLPPTTDRSPDHDAAFARAVASIQPFLVAKIQAIAANLRARDMVADALAANPGGAILELPLSMDPQAAIDALGADHVRFVVTPSSSGGYGVTCARLHDGSYVSKHPMPQTWAGLRGADLVAASGVEGATFCHMARFYAAATTREAALALAKKALAAPVENTA